MKHPIHTGTLNQLDALCNLRQYSHAFVIADQNVAKHWLDRLEQAIPITQTHLILPAGEQTKHVQTLQRIWTAMHRAGCDRKSVVIALGGGQRKLLNFGHTVGHAVESLCLATDTPLLHGEAISIGMVIEAELSVQAGLLKSADATRVVELLKAAGLPTVCPQLDIDELLTLMRSDKKNSFGRLQCTLLRSLGEAVWDQTVNEQDIAEAVSKHWERS